jgi:hypothetical protein
MNVKYLAAACAALGATSAFAVGPAAVYDPTVAITGLQVVYIAGASAQKNALYATVPTTIFDTAARDVLHIKNSGNNKDEAWLGDSKATYGVGGVSTPTLVIYNSKNGSAAGLNQVISSGTAETEASVMTYPLTGCGTAGAVSSPDIAKSVQTCATTVVAREADGALSDVYAPEFSAGYLVSGSALKNAGTSSTSGLEGFGIIVNSVLYDALLAQNIADGQLPAGCSTATASSLVVGTGNGACQPSIRSTDYTSFATSGGQYYSFAAFVPGQTDRDITLCRRDHLSGTQAASNLFFLNDVCGTKGYKGSLLGATSADAAAASQGASNYIVVDEANSGTDKAENCVWSGSAAGTTAYANYALGVVSLGEKDSVDSAAPQANFTSAQYYFVKLDGISPNYTAAGVLDATHRVNLANGSYKFATEMAAYVKSATSTTAGAGKIVKAVVDDISKATLSSVTGIAYLTGGTYGDGKTARYSKGQAGNNCAAWQ